MKQSFTFNGKSSDSFAGLIVCELPSIKKPPKRYNKISIDGRDGDIIETLGYEAYDKEIKIALSYGYDIDALFEWLDGSGDLILSNEPNRIYTAELVDEIDFERLVCFKTGVIKFHIQPYKISTHTAKELFRNTAGALSGTVKITNEGNTTALPQIRLTVAGKLSLTVNGVYCCTIETQSSSTLTLYCEEQEIRAGNFVKDGALCTSLMSGDFPVLSKGENTIDFSVSTTNLRGLTIMQTKHYSRWL